MPELGDALNDLLPRLRGLLADRYTIEQMIGEGGMATVYRARDLRHDRPVAIKVLKSELGAVLGPERFEAEIRVTANLQHPNLLPLFDSGAADGLLYYVMPFIEGETLRARLDREKQLPVDEAIRLAVAVANALKYAHGFGIVHRDLKPENILLQAGQPVVADFGIALAVSNAGGQRVTQTGLSLGTPQYMSPEQATGDRAVDARSDIYALGAVTYEMLSGEVPHTGATTQAIIARLLTEAPRSLRSERPNVPEYVDDAVLQALEKLPADRFATAAQFADALSGRSAGSTARSGARKGATDATRSRWRDPVVWALAAISAVSLGGAVFMRARRARAASVVPVVRFEVSKPDSIATPFEYVWPGAISSDGRRIAFLGNVAGQASPLWLRSSDQLAIREIPGSLGADNPIFSPDGEWVAFTLRNGTLSKVRLATGQASTLATIGENATGLDWSRQGDVVIGATTTVLTLQRVSADGGPPHTLTRPLTTNANEQHRWPIVSDDGRWVVFTVDLGSQASMELAVASMTDGHIVKLSVKGVRPLALLDGHLVYLDKDGAVVAVPIDVAAGRVGGASFPVLDQLPPPVGPGFSPIYLSRGGALLQLEGTSVVQAARIASGASPSVVRRSAEQFFAYAPDGRSIASIRQVNGKSRLAITHLASGETTLLPIGNAMDVTAWTPDGVSVVYEAGGAQGNLLVRQSVNTSIAPDTLTQLGDIVAISFDISPDGRHALLTVPSRGNFDVVEVALGDSVRASPMPVAATAQYEFGPHYSPDGRWLSYVTDANGSYQVMVQSRENPALRAVVSNDTVFAGLPAFWGIDGTSLYWHAKSGRLSVAKLALSSTPGSAALAVVGRDTLPTLSAGSKGSKTLLDGTHFFGNMQATDGAVLGVFVGTESRFIAVPNWIQEFRERVAANRSRAR